LAQELAQTCRLLRAVMIAQLARLACVTCALTLAHAAVNASDSNISNDSASNASKEQANASSSATVVPVGTSELEADEHWSDKMLTDGLLNGISLAVGLIIIIAGRHLPTLGGGSLVLALFFAKLMKSGQEHDPHVSQWPWWPIIIMVASMICLTLLVWFLRRLVTAVLTGVVLAVAALSFTVIVALEFLKVGLPVALVCLVVGAILGWRLTDTERFDPQDSSVGKWFFIGLSALIGAFLLVDGCAYFISERDLARDITRSVLSAEKKEAIADDARPVVISWLVISVVLPVVRPVVAKVCARYKPRLSKRDECSTSLKSSNPEASTLGRVGDTI